MAAVIIILTKSVLVFKLGNFTNPEMWYRKHILVSFVWPLHNGRAVNLLSPKNAGNNESQASGSKKTSKMATSTHAQKMPLPAA